MFTGVRNVRRQKAVAWAFAIHLSKQHLHFAFPGHLREFVHGGDQQRGRAMINVLINHHDGQAFLGGRGFRERANPQGIAAIGDGPPDVAGGGVHLEVLHTDGFAAPRATGDVVRRTDPVGGLLIMVPLSLFQHLGGLLQGVGGVLLADPQA